MPWTLRRVDDAPPLEPDDADEGTRESRLLNSRMDLFRSVLEPNTWRRCGTVSMGEEKLLENAGAMLLCFASVQLTVTVLRSLAVKPAGATCTCFFSVLETTTSP